MKPLSNKWDSSHSSGDEPSIVHTEVGAVPPQTTPSTEPLVEELGACVVADHIVTVDNMRQTPTFVYKVQDEQHRQALDDLRPRFAPIPELSATPSAIAPVLAGVIRDASTPRSSIVPAAVEIAIMDRGRVVLATTDSGILLIINP